MAAANRIEGDYLLALPTAGGVFIHLVFANLTIFWLHKRDRLNDNRRWLIKTPFLSTIPETNFAVRNNFVGSLFRYYPFLSRRGICEGLIECK